MLIRLENLSKTRVLRLPRPGLLIQSIKPKTRAQRRPLEDCIFEVIADFDFSLTGPVEALPGGARNEIWLLPTTAGKKVLKRYKASLDMNQIQYEHAIFQHLEQKHFPTTRLVHNQRGESILQSDGRQYAMFDFLEGYYRFSNYLFFPSQQRWFLTEMGRSLANLHLALRDFDSPTGSTFGFQSSTQNRIRDLDWFLTLLDKSRKASEAALSEAALTQAAGPTHRMLLGWVKEIEERLRQTDEKLSAVGLERTTIHGDYGAYNIMVKPNAPMCVLDFELARLDWRQVDLVSACSTTTSGDPPGAYLPKIKRLIAGYKSVSPLPQEELEQLPSVWQFLLLRRVIFCWDKFIQTGEASWVKDIQKRLSRLQWVEAHQYELARLSASI